MNTSILTPLNLLFPPFKPLHKPKPKPGPISSMNPLLPSITHFHHLSSPPSSKTLATNASGSAQPSPELDHKYEHEHQHDELVIEASITRTLPPALTLHHGVQALMDALQEFKLNPPSCPSGLVRFQVAVPPNSDALNWFCCQPESSEVFPQFYLSKLSKNDMNEPAINGKTCGAFGIGAAVSFRQSSSGSDEWNSFRRFLLVDSLNITAYGFIDTNYDIQSSILKHETGSFYFIIPQIELNEYEGYSLLAGTFVWGCTVLLNFDQACHSYERSLMQAMKHVPLMVETSFANIMEPTIRRSDLSKNDELEMVYAEAPKLGRYGYADASKEMKIISSSDQFCIKLSAQATFAVNLFDPTGTTSRNLQDCANINSLWASLIVEECSRLGLTYFCVAPGSRSSPLAVAASTHPRITCTACYDERSLAFHALGYARGSKIPAVVITTSGTAVSNLYPAVVEASQDFVPLVLLTADRPPELHAAGANQAIDQVNHFGPYVRFFFNLPAPTDHCTARMVLTTIDSAFYWASRSPYGPVHLNCQFREPLDNSPKNWDRIILDKLDSWILSTLPFTRYINLQSLNVLNTNPGLSTEVVRAVQNSERGLLVVGAIHNEEEMWATLVLARHLSWPIVADILSGLRMRQLSTSLHEYKENFVFLDHFDHMLLCGATTQWPKLDVVIQVGSKLTSKRTSQFLEQCYPSTYIMVDKHPCRHDPSHILTHRIESTISQFAAYISKITIPSIGNRWSSFLQAMDSAVAWALSFQICSEQSLTEPYVAHALSEVLASETALFIGNSMAIRDADMYSQGIVDRIGTNLPVTLPCQWIRVAGNRGASGIDGLLSTATGFGVGCKKRVLCVVGDVSFLHDTNGLATFSSRMLRKPITVIVINNRGGGIFSFLPIAEKTEPNIMEKYFYCNHSISIGELCAAHGVLHRLVETKVELRDVLMKSQQAVVDCVIEVASSIDTNTAFHSILRNHANQTASHAFITLSLLSAVDNSIYKIVKLEYSLYCIHLAAPLTTLSAKTNQSNSLRRGFILALTLDDGSTGFGEIAPLEIHEENFQDVEEQLRFLLHILKGEAVPCHLSLLKESFSGWIWKVIGVLPGYIFPSVRCGLEMAILNAIATRNKCSLFGLLWPQQDQGNVICAKPASIDICALVDSEGTPQEVAELTFALVQEGFRSVKVKVARRVDPKEDAAVIQEIRKRIGSQVELRVDANRKWTYEEAIEFSSLVKECGLQYIEEPVQCEDDILKFCEETNLPVALDETVDKVQGNIPDFFARYSHPGIVALVLKPGVLGGFENSAAIALWAHSKGKLAVVSSAFESSLGLSSYVQFACYLEMRGAEISQAVNKMENLVAHGLGTYKWLKEDVTIPLNICRQSSSSYMGASIADADCVLRNFQMNSNVMSSMFNEDCITYQTDVKVGQFSHLIKVQETGDSSKNNVLIFLHGFLGTGEDWIPIMKALSGSAKCISVDLPGHGRSRIQSSIGVDAVRGCRLSIEEVAAVMGQLLDKITPGKVTLVGYSMGARIALYMALKYTAKVDGAVLISGSPGMKSAAERRIRAAIDDSRACSLVSFGLSRFLGTWYHGDLWKSLREHPHFDKIVASRSQHDDILGLAKSLSDLSIGRQPSLWEDLSHCKIPLLYIVGEKDMKFKAITQEICEKTGQSRNHDAVEVPGCGHAVHLENPLALVKLVREFLSRTRSKTLVP